MKGLFRNVIWGLCCVTLLFLNSCCLPGRRMGKVLEEIVTDDELLSALTPDDVSEQVTQRTAGFQSLRGLGKVRLDVWEEKYKFSEIFVLEPQNKFRLETLGAFDQPAVFLTSDGQRLSAYSKKQDVHFTGIVSQENLFQLSGINFAAEDMILVFSGNPPQLSHIDYEWGFYVPDIQRYFLERRCRQENVGQRIWFDVTRQVISKLQEYRLTNGEITLEVQFEDYRVVEEEAYPIPRIIKIESPFERTRLEVTYNTVDVNHPIDDPTVFRFQPSRETPTCNLDDPTDEPEKYLAPYKEFQIQTKMKE